MKMTNDCMTFYFQLTNECDAGCKHCYNSSVATAPSNFNHKQAIKFVDDYVNTYHPNYLHFNLHGGEPLQYASKEDLEFVKVLIKSYPLAQLSVQSHLQFDPYLSKSAERLLAEVLLSGGSVGTSYQGTDINVKNGPSNEAMFYLLEEYGIRPHLSFMLSKNNCEKTIDVEMFQRYSSVQFERLTKSGRAKRNPEIFPTLASQNDFLLNTLKVILEKGTHKKTKFHFYQAIAQLILNNEPLLGQRRCRGCEIGILTITPDGFVRGCPDESKGEYLGTIWQPIKDIVEGHPRRCLIVNEKMTKQYCIGCDFYRTICRGDCYKQEWESATECRAPINLYKFMLSLDEETLRELL